MSRTSADRHRWRQYRAAEAVGPWPTATRTRIRSRAQQRCCANWERSSKTITPLCLRGAVMLRRQVALVIAFFALVALLVPQLAVAQSGIAGTVRDTSG